MRARPLPCVISLVGVAASLQARALPAAFSTRSIDVAFAWPWVALASVFCWLAVVELRLRAVA